MSLFTRFQRNELTPIYTLSEHLRHDLDDPDLSGRLLSGSFVEAAKPLDAQLAKFAARLPVTPTEVERFLNSDSYFSFHPAAANLLRLLGEAMQADTDGRTAVAAKIDGNLAMLRLVGHLDDADYVDEEEFEDEAE